MSTNTGSYQKKLNDLLSTGKKRSYAVAAITVFFILLMSLVGIIPALSSLGVQHEENAKRDVIIGKLNTKLTTLKDFVKQKTDKSSVISYLDVVFPIEYPEKDVVNKLKALEVENSVLIKNYIFGTSQSGSQDQISAIASRNAKVMNVSFVADGSLPNIQAFIKDLETSRRIFDVKEVVVTRKIGTELTESNGVMDFNLSGNLDFYYYDTDIEQP